MDNTVLILLGATGDLVVRKIIPSLYYLVSENKLPENFRVIAFARRDFNDGKYIEIIKESLGRIPKYANLSEESLQEFASIFTYCQGDLGSKESFLKLSKVVSELNTNSKIIYYLAIAQSFYPNVIPELGEIADSKSKIIIEKPFGDDESSARELNKLLLSYFTEEQIYRIDHYLAKDLIREIIDFRRNNEEVKSIWNSENIQEIQIKTLEDIDVKNRGEFYDMTGALKDVGQNHLLALASFLTCDLDFNSSEEFSQKRFESLKRISTAISEESTRMQYKAYRETKNVNPNSILETYFRVNLINNGPIFKNLKIVIEGGKKLQKFDKSIVVKFKDADLIFEYGKENTITWISHDSKLEPKVLFKGDNAGVQYTAEYSKLIFECVQGDQTYFPSAEEIFEMWRIVDPVIRDWAKSDLNLSFY